MVGEVTENTSLHRGRFIERNRITSGLSSAVLVIESMGHGGTIRQVEYALSQRRPVFVVDQGKFESPEAERGFRTLMKMGAKPVATTQDIEDTLAVKNPLLI